MPLPQKVIEQLGREPAKTPGWSSGILFFSGGILLIVIAIYGGLLFGYEPYLNSQISQVKNQTNQLSQKISSTDQANLISYYSQISNLRTLITNHVLFSQFLAWLGANTEANIFYGNLSFTSGNQVALTAFGKTQQDVNQQVDIFESSPEIRNVAISNILFSPAAGTWTFDVTLTMQPSLFLWHNAGTSGTSTTASSSLIGSSGTGASSTAP